MQLKLFKVDFVDKTGKPQCSFVVASDIVKALKHWYQTDSTPTMQALTTISHQVEIVQEGELRGIKGWAN